MLRNIIINQNAVLTATIILLSFVLFSCNGAGNGSGSANGTDKDTVITDTAPGVIITPPHDTTSVITPPPTNDSNVVVPR